MTGFSNIENSVPMIEVAAGGFHTVGLKQDGSVACWGACYAGQCLVPPGLSGVISVTAGYSHSVALRNDGTVVSWGSQSWVPPGLDHVIAISAGDSHTLALKQDRTVIGWGSNGEGQCNPPPGLSAVASIAGGGSHSVALRQDGVVVCWGSNSAGESDVPADLAVTTSIAAAQGVTFAVTADGSLRAWGSNWWGIHDVPAGLGPVRAVTAGEGATCAFALRTDGTVAVWGAGSEEYPVPEGLSGVVALTAGNRHAIALKVDGSLVGWGWSQWRQVSIPPRLDQVTAIASGPALGDGYGLTLALNADGTVGCWGTEIWDYSAAKVPPGISGVASIAIGSDHAIARHLDGTVTCWGWNGWGQCNVPAGLGPVAAIAAGAEHSVSLRPDGVVRCWGSDLYAQVSGPDGMSNVASIAANWHNTVLIRLDRSLSQWGEIADYIGNAPMGATPVLAAAVGAGHLVCVRQDGTVACDGWNDAGQCDVPAGLACVTAVSAGYEHSVALRQDGTVACWGNIGTLPGLDGVVAISAGNGCTVALTTDNCPGVVNVDQSDLDEDGKGDACDGDIDGDGADNGADGCPDDAAKVSPGLCGCGEPDTDSDSDATPDCLDACPIDAVKTAPGACGCGTPDTDTDADATPDCLDACPVDAAKTAPGTCGCGVADVDADADGVLDCLLAESIAALATLAPGGAVAGDDFGASVAVGSALAAVGAPFDDLPGKVDAGSVRIFSRTGATWSEATTIVAPDAVLKDRFGAAISLSGDALVVGAPFADVAGMADAGAAYLFRRAGTAWSFERKFTRATPSAGDRFGWAVAVRGDLVAIGSPLANRGGLADSGEVSIFRRVGTAWVATATVGSLPVTASDQCGVSVSIGGPPETPLVAAGAPGDDETGKLNCGAIYAFTLGTDASVTGSTRLVSSPPIAAAGLGASVAVDSTGGRIAAGAPLADFTGMTDRGAISVWQRAGSTWSASSPTHPYLSAGDRFGASIAWSTDDACLVVGAPNDVVGGLVNRGSVAVLSRRGNGSYQLHDLLVLPASGTSPSLFGTAVASGDAGLVVGAPKHLPPAGGTARLFAAPSPCAGIDSDSDGTDDCTDADDDNDGTADGSDSCGRDPLKTVPGACGCGVPDTDSDADGTADCHDLCPGDPGKIVPGQCGCGTPDTDTDSDGTADCHDGCPGDPAKLTPGQCGCGSPETGDSDGDGLVDCLDGDDDGDGTVDGSDGCPLDAGKTAPGQCGCGVPDLDTDGDGVADCNDGCPSDAGKIVPGTCGCGVADTDADADGLVDCLGGGTLTEIAALPTGGVASGDDFGAAVAADGDLVVVGLPLDDLPGKIDAGSARVYRRIGGAWSQEAQLLAPAAASKARDYFGASVAVHGDVIAVGAPSGDLGGLVDAGATFVYRRIGGTWSLESSLSGTNPATTDRFGFAVAVRGDLVVVGAPQADPEGQADAGEITVFRHVAGLRIPAEVLVSEPPVAGNRLGHALALGGETTSTILAAGLPGLDLPGKLNCGGAMIVTLEADGTATSTTTAVASPPLARSALGTAITIDEAGSTVAAGGALGDRPGIGTDSGIVTLWSLVNDDWVATDLVPPDHAAGERYGTSMAFTSDGSSLAIGSPYDTVANIPQRGSVAVFRRQASGWSMFDRLVITGGVTASRFGTAVAGSDGSFAVGAPKHGPPAGGAVRLFAAPPSSSP